MEKKKILGILLGAAILLVLAAGILWTVNEFTLALTLEGSQEITLEYGESYSESGSSARLFGTLLVRDGKAVEVVTEGSVDTTKVGTYELTYTATWLNLVETRQRLVHVVDTRQPVITLEADPAGYTLPGQVYQEEGYSAIDNYDGDITDLVIRTETADAVIYSVTDSSGNQTQVSRIINYDDPIAPELTLLGETSIAIDLGTQFEEPGFAAADNCEGDITEKVTVSGEVNIYVPGEYTLEYAVSDHYGNIATASRTVTVNDFETSGVSGVIYLTFDDGPSYYTPRLLEILAKYDVKATFFVCDTTFVETLPQIAEAGHAIGIHSASHDYDMIYASEEAFFADLEQMQQIIKQYTGQTTNLIRFPGGSSNTVSRFNPGIMTRLTQAVQERGYYYFDWNANSLDASGANDVDLIYRNVASGIKRNMYSVVLQHDTRGRSVEAVEEIIQWGLARGYVFAPLSPSSPVCHHELNN